MSKTIVRLRADFRGPSVQLTTFRAAARGRRAVDRTVVLSRDELGQVLKDGTVANVLKLSGFEPPLT